MRLPSPFATAMFIAFLVIGAMGADIAYNSNAGNFFAYMKSLPPAASVGQR